MPALYNRDIPYCDDFYEFDYIKYPTEVKTVTFKFLVIGDYGVGKLPNPYSNLFLKLLWPFLTEESFKSIILFVKGGKKYD